LKAECFGLVIYNVLWTYLPGIHRGFQLHRSTYILRSVHCSCYVCQICCFCVIFKMTLSVYIQSSTFEEIVMFLPILKHPCLWTLKPWRYVMYRQSLCVIMWVDTVWHIRVSSENSVSWTVRMNTYATHSDFHTNGEIKWHWTGFSFVIYLSWLLQMNSKHQVYILMC